MPLSLTAGRAQHPDLLCFPLLLSFSDSTLLTNTIYLFLILLTEKEVVCLGTSAILH